MQKQNNRLVGSEKEAHAATFLGTQNIQILEKNYRIRSGEIDLVGTDGEFLIFFEVKYRRNLKYDSPLAAVTYKKQCVICRVCDYYRMVHHLSAGTKIRFDVIGICGNEITWIKNAFPYRYHK